MSMVPHVLLIGRATLDEELFFDDMWQPGDNITVSGTRTRVGGLVSWAAGALSKEGFAVTQWGSTGEDVPVGYVTGAHDFMFRDGYAHRIRVCVEPGGQRTFLSSADEEYPPLVPLAGEQTFDAVVIDGYALLPERNGRCAQQLLPRLLRPNAPIVVALPVPRKLAHGAATEFAQTLQELNVDVVVGGAEEQQLFPGPQSWHRVTTTGTRPWISVDFPQNTGRLKVLVSLIDSPRSTNGAGDAFAGVLAAALAQRDWFWPAAIRAAHAAASDHVASSQLANT